jgi:hypothetical protein
MSADKALQVVNAASLILDLLAQYNISAQKLIDMRAANGGASLTRVDLEQLSDDAQAAIDSIQG